MPNGSDGSVIIKADIDASAMDKSAKDVIDKAENAGKQGAKAIDNIQSKLKGLGKVIAATFAISRVVAFSRECMRAAQIQTEAELKLAVVMKQRMNATDQTVESVKKLASELQKVGVVGDEATLSGAQQLATFMNNAENLKTLIPAMQNLAAQQFGTNVSPEAMKSMGNLFGKAMQGQVGALTRYGITLSDAEKKIIKYGDEAQRAATIAKAITNNVGEMNKALGQTPDGQIAQLKNNFGDLKEELGKAIKNFILPIIKGLNLIVQKLVTVASLFNQLSEKLMGVKAIKLGSGGTGGAEDVEDVSEAYDDLAESEKKAKKEQDKYLSGLDEIQRFTDPEEDDSSALGGGEDTPGGSIGDIGTDEKGLLGDVSKILDKIIDKLMTLKNLFVKGFFDGLGESWKKRVEEISTDAQSIVQTLKNIFTDPELVASADNFANSFAYSFGVITGSAASVGLTIGQLVTGGIESFLRRYEPIIKNDLIKGFDIGQEVLLNFSGLTEDIAGILEVFGSQTMQEIFGSVLGTIYTVASNSLLLVLSLASLVIESVATVVSDNKEKIITAIDGIINFIAPIMAAIESTVSYVFGLVWNLYNEKLKPTIDDIVADISELFGIILDGWNTYVQPVLDNIAADIVEYYDTDVKPMLDGLFAMIGSIIDLVKSIWDKVVVPILKPIAEAIMPAISSAISWLWKNILKPVARFLTNTFGVAFSTVSGIIDEFVIPAIENLDEMIDGIKEHVETLKENVKGPLNAIIGFINQMIAAVKTGINYLISAINKINIQVPEWVPVYGGAKWGFNITPLSTADAIPYLAQGTVIPPNSPHLAVVGDQRSGLNVEAPLDTIKQAVAEVVGTGNETINLTVELDGDVIFRDVIKHAKKLKRTTGFNALTAF